MYQAVEITCCLRAEFVNRKLSRILSAAVNDLTSLVPRPVCAIRVTREGLEPSANFPDKLDRWRHIRNCLGRLGTRLWFNIPFKGIQDSLRARSIQPKFPEISVQNSMDRFGPTGKVSKKRVHLLRWSTFPGRTGWNFGWMDRALRFRIPGSESEFFVIGTWLPDSNRWWDTGFLELHLDPKAQDSSFQKQKFPEFRVKIPLIHGGR